VQRPEKGRDGQPKTKHRAAGRRLMPDMPPAQHPKRQMLHSAVRWRVRKDGTAAGLTPDRECFPWAGIAW
jgi:hypothetical protein